MTDERGAPPSPQYPWSRGWEWINKGVEMFLAAPWIWIAMLILQMTIGIGISIIPTNGGPVGWALDLVLQVVGFILAILFDAGLLLGCHAVRRGESLHLGALFSAFSHPAAGTLIKLALIEVMAFMVVGTIATIMVTMLLIGGSSAASVDADVLLQSLQGSLFSVMFILMFVITLMLLFAMAMWMASPLVLFRGYAPTHALVESFNANFRNVRALTVYGLGMVGLALLAALPFMLGFLIWLPLTTTTRYVAFVDLFAEPSASTQTVRAL
jgi:uncharacterized membrane protein